MATYAYNRPSWHKTFIDMLEILVRRSTCLKLNTAALIVRGSQILTIGYNGTFSGAKECHEYWYEIYQKEYESKIITMTFEEWIKTEQFRERHRSWSTSHEIHAEANALKWISKANTEGCIMYTLYSPCNACAKDIIAHGIKTVYYKHKYKHGDVALQTLKNNGIVCINLL